MYGFHGNLKDKTLYGNSIQIFSRSPKKIMSPTISLSTDEKKQLGKYDHIFTHSPYYITLTKKTKLGKLNRMIINTLVKEIEFLRKNNGIGVVTHVGSYIPNDNKYLVNITKYLLAIKKNIKSGKIILENRAKVGNVKLTTVEEILKLDKYIKTNGLSDLVTYCFDTCHDFVSTNGPVSDNLLKLIKNVGAKRVSVVHLNDCKEKGKDIHANIFEGVMDHVDLVKTIKLCIKYKIPMIMENMKTGHEKKLKMLEIINYYNSL